MYLTYGTDNTNLNQVLAPEQLVVAPDGPLRTRSWEEIQASVLLGTLVCIQHFQLPRL